MKKTINGLMLLAMLTSMSACANNDPTVVEDFKFSDGVSVTSEGKILDKIAVTFDVKYCDRTETLLYDALAKENADVSFKLYKEGETTDVIDEELVADQKYTLEATYQGKTATTSFTPDERVTLLKKEDLKITYSDIDATVAPATGDVKMLVIPINLYGDWLDTWDESYLERINQLYFGDRPLDLKTYYKDASFGAMNISGMVSEVFNYTTHTSNQIQDDYDYLVDMIVSSVAKIEANHPEVNWREYDLNGDKKLDNVHLVTNFNPSLYYYETGKNPWSTNLWPHKSTINGGTGTLDKPAVATYSCGVLNHLIESETEESAITPIHEQGHIFGLPDYYDYGGQVDYLGYLDMQSNNVLDWNAYSKLSVGWTNALVIKDSAVVNIQAASLGGTSLIIPANYETFNNSAFDEYFLVELFSHYGNNAKFEDQWNYIFDNNSNGFGAKIYHVDARLIDMNGKQTSNPKKGFQLIDNNNYEYTYAMYGSNTTFRKYCDKKLLTIIQKEGEDTFGDTGHTRKMLSKEDLFYVGDTFKFEEYSHFLSKRGKHVETMDDGETFPYEISFLRMDSSSMSVQVKKVVTEETN